MTHPGTGNPTWQDFPNTSTPISAASLEAMENLLDTVGAKAPRSVPWCEVRLTANAGTAAITDLFAQGNWTPPAGGDQFGMVKVPPGSGTYTYIQAPAGWTGRYLFRYHSTTQGMGSGGTHVAMITRNGVAAVDSIGRTLNTVGSAGADGATVDVFAEVTLTGSDRVYWGNWTSVATTIPAVPSGLGVPTAMFARYLGPA